MQMKDLEQMADKLENGLYQVEMMRNYISLLSYAGKKSSSENFDTLKCSLFFEGGLTNMDNVLQGLKNTLDDGATMIMEITDFEKKRHEKAKTISNVVGGKGVEFKTEKIDSIVDQESFEAGK